MPSLASPSRDASVEERILLFGPDADDVAGAVRTLEGVGFQCTAVASLDALVAALKQGAGVLVVDEGSITERAVRLLGSAMAQRPPWSNLPIVVLVDDDPAAVERLDALDLFGPATPSNTTILKRPLHNVTLTTVVRSGLRARRRQYEVRDLLANLEARNDELREAQSKLQRANDVLEDRVAARTEQVRRLAGALSAAEQRERSRIAEVLHDHLQQLIRGARMWATLLSGDDEQAPPDALNHIIDLLDEATSATRSLTVELSPPVLRREGLVPALRWLTDWMADTHGLHVRLDVPPHLTSPEADLRDLLFRAVRELLFNVVKHAGVDTAALRVRSTDDHCVVLVADEGAGFEVASLDHLLGADKRFGLSTVRERLRLVGGALSIDSAPGAGTRVRIEVPLRL